MFLVSNSDNLTIPNFLQALGFVPPAGMSVEEIIIQQDNQSQAQKTLETSGFEDSPLSKKRSKKVSFFF